MPQWMKRPNLASRHHFILASCCSLVSVGAAARAAWAAPKPRPTARNSLLFMRLVTLLSFSFLRGRLRTQSGAVDRYDGVGMLLARLGRPVEISHLGDRRLGRVVV